ncbi:hypothetical protein L6452_32081 [Arctium lappa]|uniref:Uncharacterized protein n=1 Tax=Arctium lappa TaxID=4217 RepID=A0ACB8Z3B2_ARCLA|nr:hypothetical protein L6452_32081 [Arctium lappa]
MLHNFTLYSFIQIGKSNDSNSRSHRLHHSSLMSQKGILLQARCVVLISPFPKLIESAGVHRDILSSNPVGDQWPHPVSIISQMNVC